MKKLILIAGFGLSVINSSFAKEIYLLQPGETISHAVEKLYPNDRIYGRRGKLAEVLKNNPQIQNLKNVPPGTKIYFTPSTTPAQTKVSATEVAPAEVSSDNKLEEVVPQSHVEEKTKKVVKKTPEEIVEIDAVINRNVSIVYGFRYLSVSQSGSLGKADLGILTPTDLKLRTDFSFDEIHFGLLVETYSFKHTNSNDNDPKRMYAANLYSTYKWLYGGLGFEQNPLFKVINDKNEMTRMTLMYLSLGLKKDFRFKSKNPTLVSLKTWASLPISSTTENSNTTSASVSGIAVNGQFEVGRNFFERDDYSLQWVWSTQMGMQQISQNIKWDELNGNVNSNIISASSNLGILLNF
jgi:hypothetical protein